MPLTDTQKAFLEKYLVRALTDAGPDEDEDNAFYDELLQQTDVLGIWRAAKERTDRDISKLQNALRSVGHTELDAIAETGLNGITEGRQTPLVAALMDYDRSPADQRGAATKKLSKQIQNYRIFLDGSSLVDLAEANPFGVKVSIRRPLGDALGRIQQVIR